MKKILFIIGGLLLVSVTAIKAQSGWAELGLKDYVLMMKQRCYNAQETSEGVQRGNALDCLAGNENYVFDKRGRRTEVSGYKGNNALDWKATFNYKPEENKAESALENANNEQQSKLIYHYNELGKVIEENVFNALGDLQERLVHQYEANGINKISTSCYKTKGDLKWKETYEYDEFGAKIGFVHFDANGEIGWLTVYKNDNWGNKIEEEIYDADGIELSRSTFEYIYDNNNNWIKQTAFTYGFNNTKIPEKITLREITYY